MPDDAAAALSLRLEPPGVGGHTAVLACGVLTGRTGPHLREFVLELTAGGRCRLVVDVSGVSRIDAAGLGVLVGAARRAQNGAGCLHLVDRGGRVLPAVRRSGLTALLRASASRPADSPDRAARR